MNAPTKKPDEKPVGLDLMRAPFEPHQISKLPKESRAQIEERKKTRAAGIWCSECGAFHHKKAIHVDYVGHAALTNRLLDCDPRWNWEPVSVNEDGTPKLDQDRGLWIRLTVCGVTRLGYGDAENKQGPDAMKERIGDALRNAAMRFGAALELWHKGDLHGVEHLDQEGQEAQSEKGRPEYPEDSFKANFPKWKEVIASGRKTADQIIDMVSSKAELTEKQIKAIKDCEIAEGEYSE
ncbi:MAG: hypothetical protein Q7Q73_09225 [Verrucomicrobiota bacterium JB024]|nr:hypothetical protein [Verrucomicrobiota bacterium JB024]